MTRPLFPESSFVSQRAFVSTLAMFGILLLGCGRPDLEDTKIGDSGIRQQLADRVEPDRLNIVLITIDTLRADRLSSYGSQVQTPHLDRLAADGARFTNASTTVPFTFPAHSSILTGTYPPFHGVRENVGFLLGEESRTLPQMLGDAGWQTAGFVSAFVLDARWGLAKGFDHYFDDFNLADFESPNLGSVQRPGNETIAAALEWLDSRENQESADQPFFLWLHLYDPHDPYTPPEPYRSLYPGRPYDAEVAYTDALVGDFVGELETRNLLETSALVVTSDHGEGLGDHGESSHGFFVYDSTVHVPLILRLPERLVAGIELDEAVSHVDIVPTLLDLTDQAIPDEVQGRSLLTLLDGEDGDGERENPMVYAESFYPLLHYGWAPLRVLRSKTHKYIEAPSPELFDLEADPTELSNIARTKGSITHEMSRALLALAEEIEQGAATSEEPDIDEQTLAQLQALGYLAGPAKADMSSYDPRIDRTDPKEGIETHRLIMSAQGRIGDGKQEEGAKLLEQALSKHPDLLDAHQMLGDIELRAKRPELALGHFERALAVDDHHLSSLFGLATSHRLLGRSDDALLGYRRLLALAGEDSKATLAIADLEMERGELDAAEEVLVAAATTEGSALIYSRLGEVQSLAGRPDEARKNFAIAIERNPDFSQPHFNLGVLFEESRDLAQARHEYETAIDKAPKHYQAQFNLARLVGHLGERQNEIDLLEASIASKPDFAIGHFFLGKSLMESQELARAEEVTRAGLEISSDQQLGWFVLADILSRKGQLEESNEALARGKALSSGARGKALSNG